MTVTEYMVKLRVNDLDGLGKESVREMFQEFIDEMSGNAPFDMEIDQIDMPIPKSVDNIILKGICPHCKKDALYEDERSEEYISFCCDECDRDIYISRDDMGIRLVVMNWFDESEEMEEEMEEVIYDRNDR